LDTARDARKSEQIRTGTPGVSNGSMTHRYVTGAGLLWTFGRKQTRTAVDRAIVVQKESATKE
jgi:hypothetical protein